MAASNPCLERRMKRAWKWLRRILVALAFLGVAGLTAWVAVVPELVRGIAAVELGRIGLGPVALEIRGLSLYHVQMANVASGDGERLRVGAVGVGFHIARLLDGRLDTIELTGAEVGVRLSDGRLDLGPLTEILTGGGGGGGENPFRQLQFRSSAVLLDLEGRRLRIPIEGTVSDAGGGTLSLDIRVEAEGVNAHLKGSVETNTGDLDLTLAGTAREVAALLACWPERWGKLPVAGSGSAAFRATYTRRKERLTIGARLTARRLRLAGEAGDRLASADELALAVRGTWEPGSKWPWLELAAKASKLAVGDLALDSAYVDARGPHDGLSVEVGLVGKGWTLCTQGGAARGVVEALWGEACPVTVGIGSWRCSVDPRQAAAGAFALPEWLQVASPEPVTVTGENTVLTLTPSTKGPTTSWSWHVESRLIEASWTGADITIAAPPATLRGVDARVRLAAEAGPEGITARLLPGTRLACAAASGAFEGTKLLVPKGDDPGMEVSVGEEPAELSATWKDGELDWRVRVPDLAVAVRGARVEGPMGLVAGGVEASAQLALEVSPRKATLSLGPGCAVNVAAATVPSAGAEATGVEFRLGEKGARLSASLKDGKLGWEVQAPDVRLGIGRAKAELPGGVAADGIAVAAQLGLRANPREAVATLAGGSKVVANSLNLPWLGVRKTAEGPLLSIELGEKGLEAKAGLDGSKPQWSLDIPRLVVKQAEADLVLPDGLGKVEGCRGQLAVSLEAEPGQVALGKAGKWAAGFKSAELDLGGERLRLGPVAFEASPASGAAMAFCRYGGAAPARIGGGLDVSVAGKVPVRFGQRVEGELRSVRAELAVGSPAKEGVPVLTCRATGKVRASVVHGTGGSALKASVPEAEWRVVATAPARPARRAAAPLSVEFAVATASGGAPATASIAGADITVGKAEVRGTATLGSGEPVVEARVWLGEGSVRHRASGVSAAGLSAEVPFSLNGAEQPPGKFTASSVEAGGLKLANVAGTLGVADMRAAFTLAAEPLKGAKLDAEGWLDVSRGEARGFARVSLPLFKLEDEQALARRVPALRGMLATGTVGAEGFVRLAGGEVRPTFTVTVLDGVVKSKRWDMEAEGVFATVRLNSLAPPLTPRKELQVVLVKRAKMGDLEVKNGAVAFRLEAVEAEGRPSRWAAVIQRADWGWAGGRLYVEGVRFDPGAREHHFTLHADDLKLGELLAIVGAERLAGVGALSGQLPVTIEGWPRIRFGNGYLHSAPGQRGWIHNEHLAPLEPAAVAVARGSVPRYLPRFLQEQGERQVRESALAALRDLEYVELTLDFINEGGRLLASSTTLTRRSSNVYSGRGEATEEAPTQKENAMRGWLAGTMVVAAIALPACTRHTVRLEPIEVKPIHITMDINIKVQREIEKDFAFMDEIEPETENK